MAAFPLPALARSFIPAVRERLVRHVERIIGRVPTEHHLRCVPVRRGRRATADAALVEWRAVFQAEAREWSAAGADRDDAFRALEQTVGRDAEALRRTG